MIAVKHDASATPDELSADAVWRVVADSPPSGAAGRWQPTELRCMPAPPSVVWLYGVQPWGFLGRGWLAPRGWMGEWLAQ